MDNTLLITGWHNMRLSGVKNVRAFDEDYVTLETDVGKINVEGKELRIESLSKDKGDIEIVGNITGVYYSEDKKASKGSKLFK